MELGAKILIKKKQIWFGTCLELFLMQTSPVLLNRAPTAEHARLQAVLRATGERAAAAEAQVQARSDAAAALQGELARLRERWARPRVGLQLGPAHALPPYSL